jgi:hypothetical protein
MNAWKYLDAKHYQKRLNSSMVLMSCTIHLDGKKQAVEVEKTLMSLEFCKKLLRGFMI